MSRTTKTQLAHTFQALVSAAREAGWKVDGWTFHHGSATYSYAYRITYGPDDTAYGRPLGYTASEAYLTMWHIIDTLDITRKVTNA